MKRVRYTKYVPDPAGEMSMEDLLSALSDYLLQSGFQDYMFYELPEGEKTLEELRQELASLFQQLGSDLQKRAAEPPTIEAFLQRIRVNQPVPQSTQAPPPPDPKT